jgi:hypothetical protein
MVVPVVILSLKGTSIKEEKGILRAISSNHPCLHFFSSLIHGEKENVYTIISSHRSKLYMLMNVHKLGVP